MTDVGNFRFRKRPVVIEAWRWTGDAPPMPDWLRQAVLVGVVSFTHDSPEPQMTIVTFEGLLAAPKGAWIVRGVEGELYPVAHSVFVKTYEPVP